MGWGESLRWGEGKEGVGIRAGEEGRRRTSRGWTPCPTPR